MRRTFVYDHASTKPDDAAIGYNEFGQIDDVKPTFIPGDGGIYSTVDDLFKWDQVLYTEKLVRQSTLATAFTPAKVTTGTSTYGFGWNIGESESSPYVWHSGSSAGFRAFIARRLKDKLTIVMLTNKGNSKRTEINDAILNILAGRTYQFPKSSGAEKLYKVILDFGVSRALTLYKSLQKTANSQYDVGESQLNTLGYQLLYSDKRVSDAVAIFELNADEHPTSSNAFDSLGEAYAVAADKNRAIKKLQKGC